MPRTCRTCQAIDVDEQRELHSCSNCGDLWQSLTPAAHATSTEDERLYHLSSNDWPAPQVITTNIPRLPAVRLIPDERYVALSAQSKSSALAALLSFLLVGMGQIYLGQVEKGLTMLGMVLLLMLTVPLGPLKFVILLFNVLDAFLLARRIEEGKPVLRWEFFFSGKGMRGEDG
jgi:TM2 domain-containing membrane protein YozV